MIATYYFMFMDNFDHIFIKLEPLVHCIYMKGHLLMGVQLHFLAGGGVLVDVHLQLPAGIQHSIWNMHRFEVVLPIYSYSQYLC